MGRVYHANNKDIEEFSTNVAGAHVLEDLMCRCSVSVLLGFAYTDKETARDASILLREHFNPRISKLIHKEHVPHNFTGTESDMWKWLNDFITFIVLCEGFTIS